MAQKKIRRRILGRAQGMAGGTLLVCIAGMHGNEPAGVQALDLFFKMLEVEPIRNPSFRMHGAVMGVLGNKMAYHHGQRFLDRDLNRSLHREVVADIMHHGKKGLHGEDIEIYKLIRTIQKEIDHYAPKDIVVLDLHTTTATGGIFCISSEEHPYSLALARKLYAPVIVGFDNALKGTTLEYFNHPFYGTPCAAVCFEAGQHEEPLSVNRTIAVIVNAMRALGIISEDNVENEHNAILHRFSSGLPKASRVLYAHKITPDDLFRMTPGYENFQKISKGEPLAVDRHGAILSPCEGRILMPLYQAKGEDGFFVCEDLKGGVFPPHH